MSAGELRAAASKLRDLAQRATPGPWLAEDDEWDGWRVIMPPDGMPGVAVVASDIRQGEDGGECDSHYFAAMNPLVGLALAGLLDEVAEDEAAHVAHSPSALAIARLINGSAS